MLKLSIFLSVLCLAVASPEDSCPDNLVPVEGAPLYSIYVTKLVRPGSELSVVVTLLKSATPLDVIARFTSSDGLLDLSATERIQEGESRRIPLGTIQRNYKGQRSNFKLIVEGRRFGNKNVLFRNCTMDFQYHHKSLSILIQTDKAIYRPGQTIKFRALCMDDDLRPLMGNVTYRIEDPSNNVVLKNTRVLTSGVAGSEFKLNRISPEGNWIITYSYKGTVEQMTVEVKSYKLPKFEVKVSTPSVIYPEMPGFTVVVKADYTFGQPVSGTAVIKIRKQSRSWRNSVSPEISKNLMRFEGKTEIFITMAEIRSTMRWNGNSDSNLVVTASVTETLTSSTVSKSSDVDLKRTKVKVEVLSKPQVVKPGLLYKALVRVTEQDGTPLMQDDRENDNLIIKYNYNYRTYRGSSGTRMEQVYNIPPNGLVWVEIEARDDNFTSIRFDAFTNTTRRWYSYYDSWTATRAVSQSNSYIQITPVGKAARGDLSVGDTAQFRIRSTDELMKYRVMILSRGLVIREQIQQVPPSMQEKRFSYSFSVTSDMTPSITVLVSYVRPYDLRSATTPMPDWQNEIVADSLTLDVALELRNEMSIMTNENRVDAGSNIQIRVNSTAAGSYIGLRAIDQSVLLLKSGNDVTKQRVVSELNEYSHHRGRRLPYNYYYFYPSGSKDAIEVFSETNMIVLTNALLFKYPTVQSGCQSNEVEYFQTFHGPEAVALDADEAGFSGRSLSKARSPPNPTSKTRNLFPETWLWTSGIAETDGSVAFNTTVPDTITSWEISAFSMSQTFGLGIANTQKLTVFRNFFVNLNLPLKITRGEIIIVQAIVFNYFNTSLQTDVSLLINENYRGVELIRPGVSPTLEGPNRNIIIPPGDAISIKFPIRFNITGEVPIQVMAMSSMARDSIVRNVYVKPEGIPQCYSTSALFTSNNGDLDDESQDNELTPKNMMIRIPEGAVEGSGKVSFSTYGNILGNTMANLRRLLKVPTGCGEQNMLTFAPDVFVTLYLQRTGQLDEETRKKAIEHIVSGYANQLRYMRSDGSFSAFGDRDEAGSTWLTAFVVKCFMYAREIQDDLVDKTVVDKAVRFLVTQQSPDGDFKEEGRVIHQGMQGGVNSRITMTAYVLISLLESQYQMPDLSFQGRVRDATKYLMMRKDQITNDKYALALVSYALYLAKQQSSSNLLLEELVVDGDDDLAWLQSPISGSVYSSRWAPPYSPASSKSIEIASYTLLNFFRRNEIERAIPLLRWIVSKQNELGGYSSTQDTVIAIQALYQAASFFISVSGQDLTLTASHQSTNFERSFTINRENAIVYNTIEIEPVNGDLRIRAQGTGVGIAQLSVCYNIPTTPYSQEPFSCSVDVLDFSNDYAMLELRCSMNPERTEPTGMFLYELELLNGFTVDVVEEERRNPTARLIELDQGRVNFYYDELLPQQQLYARVKLLRIAEVAAVKPATFKAYDYYEPKNIVVRTYNVDAWSRNGVCDVCGYECAGCPAPQLTDWKPWTPCMKFCAPESQTREKDCFDPSLMKKIDLFRCGLQKVPMEKRTCPKAFSCPSFSNGLWFQLPSSFGYYGERTCSVMRSSRRSPWTIIPGSTLNGNQQYIQCSLGSTGLDLRNFNRRFTISFLIKPNFFKDNAPVTLMSIGAQNRRPIVTLERPILPNNSWKFVVSIENKRDFVENISLSALPICRWGHVVLTWDSNDGGRVFINGVEVGDPISVTVGYSHKLKSSPYLYLGGKPMGNQQSQAFVSGSFSSLNIWNDVLPIEQVLGLSRFYEEIRSYDGPEPLLSVRHLRSLAPRRFKTCFRKPSYLSRIYADTPSCRN